MLRFTKLFVGVENRVALPDSSCIRMSTQAYFGKRLTNIFFLVTTGCMFIVHKDKNAAKVF